MNLDSLPPWDQIPYFQSTQSGAVPAAALGQPSAQIVQQDPNRVLLVITNNKGGSQIVVSPSQADSDAGNGIAVQTTSPTLVITQAQYGSLVSSAWFISSTPGGTAYFVSVSLKEWPKKRKRYASKATAQPDDGNGDY